MIINLRRSFSADKKATVDARKKLRVNKSRRTRRASSRAPAREQKGD